MESELVVSSFHSCPSGSLPLLLLRDSNRSDRGVQYVPKKKTKKCVSVIRVNASPLFLDVFLSFVLLDKLKVEVDSDFLLPSFLVLFSQCVIS